MRETSLALTGFILLIGIFLGTTIYQTTENRKAYYACLELTEKLVREQNKVEGSVRVTSLPYCRL